MKKIVKSAAILLAVVAISGTAYSQGTIGFANNPLTKISNMDGSFAAGVTVGLYYSSDTGSDLDTLSLLATTSTQAGALAGVFNGGTQTIGSLAPTTPVLVEVRAWDNGAASYEEALALGTGNAGRSGALSLINLGGGGLPTPSLTTQGQLKGFALSPVPEPSTIALGILGGLGAMVLLRRRK
jgi:hypothetical protein